MIDFDTIQIAVSDVLSNVISYVPRLLSAMIILIIGWFVAKLLAGVVLRLANQIQFDKLIEKIGLTDSSKQAQLTRTPSEMLSQFIFWLIFLNILLLVFEILGSNMAVNQLQSLINYLPNILAALIVFVVGALLAQLVGQAVQAAVASTGIEFHQAIGKSVRGLFMVLVVIIAVGQLGVNTAILINVFTNLVTIAAAGLALAFGLGGREVARNVLAGHYARDVFDLGDRVVIDDSEGTIEAIGTLNTEILVDQEMLVIPNTRLTEKQVTIRSSDVR